MPRYCKTVIIKPVDNRWKLLDLEKILGRCYDPAKLQECILKFGLQLVDAEFRPTAFKSVNVALEPATNDPMGLVATIQQDP